MGGRISNRVRDLRDAHDRMTQQALADQVGVSRQTINAIETGKYQPSLEVALKIARAFDQAVEAVFRLED
ncbi:helix-turn-helix transcriptional regulator [Wenzhouxiangella marina]|uniref:XRE family transcriptional regulator n=1 Tax=Wenzhouxiangella marina TaxID=1579979 RepID=A0A0K0XZ71_9GAMM|nr:helix-turn-helix transcriptional regulator [Wenzhouxiangella marina]AKS42988.1 XRE family transcriptional regulator [Wenzhouxiangella marina]MBB6087329.1 putative transcriptional regulator [Wenzhouxiangella marina]